METLGNVLRYLRRFLFWTEGTDAVVSKFDVIVTSLGILHHLQKVMSTLVRVPNLASSNSIKSRVQRAKQ